MVLQWERRQAASTSALFSDYWALVELPPGVALRRLVLQAFIAIRSNQNDTISYWAGRGIVHGVEITTGSPPPFPLDPATSNPNGRDWLHWGITHPWQGGQVLFQATAAGDGGIIRVDTDVQRIDNTNPMQVWWSWGVQGGPPGGTINGALTRFASAALVDGPDIP